VTIRTVERGYPASRARRAGQVTRVHIIREGKPAPRNATYLRGVPDGQLWCGQNAGDHRDSTALVRDAPHELPEGLSWCPHCLGRAAEHLGKLGDVARLLGIEALPAPWASHA
jgi:hypothetical protein